MVTLSLLLSLLGVAWFWFDSLRALEIAKGVCRQLCQHYQVQWLDDSLALRRVRPQRVSSTDWWHWRLQRLYTFEFTASGAERTQGSVLMLGVEPVFVDLPGYYERVLTMPT